MSLESGDAQHEYQPGNQQDDDGEHLAACLPVTGVHLLDHLQGEGGIRIRLSHGLSGGQR